jgi:60 kDa SS-A/Ro ribonucleoprotein
MTFAPHWPGIAPAPLTPQTRAIPGRATEMAPNAAGGFGFLQPSLQVLERFLILGTAGGTFYVDESTLVTDVAPVVERALVEHPAASFDLIIDVLRRRRAVRMDAAIFALALWFAKVDPDVRTAILHGGERARWRDAVAAIETGSQLLLFVSYWCQLRGLGRSIKSYLRDWYVTRDVASIEYQVLKYANRHGFTHRDLLRIAHIPLGRDPEASARHDLFAAVCLRDRPSPPKDEATRVRRPLMLSDRWHAVEWFRSGAADTASPQALRTMIQSHRLSHDMLPSTMLAHDHVWHALAPQMPAHALLRNLATLTRRGVFGPAVLATPDFIALLERIRDLTVHPLHLLKAQRVYASGGAGGLSQAAPFTPDSRVVNALSDAINRRFEAVTPIAARMLVGVDVSGSMEGSASVERLFSCRELAIATACWLTRAAEAAHQPCRVIGFDTQLTELPVVHARASVWDAMRHVVNGGGTDATQPIRAALDPAAPTFDAIVLLTDNDSWRGFGHVTQLMAEYRRLRNPSAKLVVFSMVTGKTMLADPTSPLDFAFVGWDAASVDALAAVLPSSLLSASPVSA